MGTTTKLTFDEYLQLPESEGPRCELDEGTLVIIPSPTWWHNSIRDRIASRLREFVNARRLGRVITETEFRLSADTARTPDVAFVTAERFSTIDIYHSPVDGPPDLAVEVISPSNQPEDTVKKIHQYLDAGCRSVWVIYPALHRAVIHSKSGAQDLEGSEALKEEALLPGFFLSLSYVLDPEEL